VTPLSIELLMQSNINFNQFYWCKKEKKEETKIEINQENKTELDVREEAKRLIDSISHEIIVISKIKELADKGDKKANKVLSIAKEKIKTLNN
jgi:hypothetical protein